MAEVFTGTIGFASGNPLYWYEEEIRLPSNAWYAADNVNIIAGFLYVNQGASASNIVVSGITYQYPATDGSFMQYSARANILVYSGGSASNVTISGPTGRLAIDEGAVVTDLYLNAGAQYSNGTGFFQLYVEGDGGYIEKMEGLTPTGLVSNLDFTGQFHASSATLENVTFDCWYVDGNHLRWATADLYDKTVVKGGVVSCISAARACVYLHSGASASGTVVDGGYMEVLTRAQGRDIVTQSGGTVDVAGTAYHTIINEGGWQKINATGIASNTVIHSGGTQIITGNGSALNTSIGYGGGQYLSSGVASNTRIMSGGKEIVSGYELYDNVPDTWSVSACVEAGGSQVVGFAKAMYTQVYGRQILNKTYYGGSIYSSIIHSGGELYIFGGRASLVQVNNGATVFLDGPGTLETADIYGSLCLESGTLSNVCLYSGAVLDVVSTSYSNIYSCTILSGATANFSSGCSMFGCIISGGVVTMEGSLLQYLSLSNGIVLRNGLNGTFNSGYSNTITSEGIYKVESGVREWYLNVSAGGWALVYDTEVYSGTVGSGGVLYCGENTRLSYQTVSSGGSLMVAGASATQNVTISSGGMLNFNISDHDADDLDACFSGFTNIYGTISFSVTVGKEQSHGTYVLADEDAAWVTSLYLTDRNGNFYKDANGNYIRVRMNEDAVAIGETAYSLSLGDNNSLLLTVGEYVSTDDWTDMAKKGAASQKIGSFGKASIYASFDDEIGKNDSIDYLAVELDSAANLSFTINSTNAAKFTLCQLQEKNGKYSLKALQSVTLKANATADSKAILLEKGTYYIAMAATDKKSADAPYTITVNNKSVFFTKGDNSDDWNDMKNAGAEGAVGNLGNLTEDSGTVVEDGWVGYGDAIDYMAFTLEGAANLTFDVTATDAAKFTIYQLQEKVSKGVKTYSLKNLQSTALKANKDKTQYTAATKNLMLEAGTYYVAMESTNAKKGGSADYTLALGESSKFYPASDTTDNWANMKTEGADDLEATLGNVTAESGMLREDGWVGFGDTIDYASFTLESAANLAFNVTATDATKFSIYQLQEKTSKGIKTYSLKSLQSISLKANKDKTQYTASTKNLMLTKGTYYVSMESTNAKKGGYADYTIASSENSSFFTKGNNEDDAWDAENLPSFEGQWEDWTGYGDALDYRRLDLATPTRLALDLTATDATKFTVWQLDAKGKLKSLQATTLKANKDKTLYTASTKELLLKEGTYYVSMECTTAKKGGSADFTVAYGDRHQAFENCDNSNDTWQAASEQAAVALGDALAGWVGFGDTADFYKFEVADAGKLSIVLDDDTSAALTGKQIKFSCLDAKGKNVSLAAFKGGTLDSSKALAAGEYYLGITCANAQKYETSYNVSIGLLA